MLRRAAVQLWCGSPLHNCSLKQRGLPHMTTQYKNHSRKRTPWDCNTSLSPMETFIESKYLDSYDYKHPLLKKQWRLICLIPMKWHVAKDVPPLILRKKALPKMVFKDIIATSARDILMSLKELCLIITRLQYPNGLNSVWVFSDMRVSI